MFYGEVFKALNKAKVKYVVAGGVAVVLHGYHRSTKDLDIIALLEKKNLEKLFDALASIGYIPKVPVTKKQFVDKKQRERWKKEKGMLVFSFVERNPPFKLVDMFVDEPFPFKEIYGECIMADVEDLCIPLIGIEQLRQIKLKAGRPQDLYDAVQLKAIQEIKKK